MLMVLLARFFRVRVVDYTTFIGCLPSLSRNDRPKLSKRIVSFQARFVFLLIYSCKSDLTRDDSQRRFWAQHSVAILEQCCNVVLRWKSSLRFVSCNVTLSPLITPPSPPPQSWAHKSPYNRPSPLLPAPVMGPFTCEQKKNDRLYGLFRSTLFIPVISPRL